MEIEVSKRNFQFYLKIFYKRNQDLEKSSNFSETVNQEGWKRD